MEHVLPSTDDFMFLTAKSPLANQSSSPWSPQSPSTILDKKNAAVTEYLTSNPSVCLRFA